MAAHACRPLSWEGEAGESEFQASLGYTNSWLENPNAKSAFVLYTALL